MQKIIVISTLLLVAAATSFSQAVVISKPQTHKEITPYDSTSMPKCFEKVKDSAIAGFYKYLYKGQIWFYAKQNSKPVLNQKICKQFYNADCKLVCTIQSGGGVVSMQKAFPDTVEIGKLMPFVPQKIKDIAIQKKAAYISICDYMGETVYLIAQKSVAENRSTYNFTDEYYFENGELAKTNSYKNYWNSPRKEQNTIPEIIRIKP